LTTALALDASAAFVVAAEPDGVPPTGSSRSGSNHF